ncbi:hypothetical protein RND81_04G236000 [Saponaria officinalis]|uniref:Uncharacterized protein n=1 Tax=Saponaria officinalis TaxID=3572 RepID=A0AAW1LNY2_SAPOF
MESIRSERGVILSKEKLKTLAKLLQWQEQERIKSIRFRSEKHRSEYLRCSRETYEQTVALLDENMVTRNIKRAESESESESETTAKVVRGYLEYLEMVAGYGMEMVKGVHLRFDFLKKVREHADSLIPRINELREGSLEASEIELKAKDLIKELSVMKEAMYKSLITKTDPSFQNFSKSIKLSGNSFEDLVSKYHKKLVREKGDEYNKPFELLKDEQKIEVYDEIIKSSGRGTFLSNTAYKVVDKIGKGLLIFTLAMAVWDIYSSEHKLQAVTTEVAEFGAGYAGGYVGEIAGAAVATYLVTAVGVAETAATAAFVGLTAFVTGFGLAIGLGILAGYVVGKIFESGGKHAGGAITVKKDESKLSTVQKHLYQTRVYAAPMPNGALLARQLAYDPKASIVALAGNVAAVAVAIA